MSTAQREQEARKQWNEALKEKSDKEARFVDFIIL